MKTYWPLMGPFTRDNCPSYRHSGLSHKLLTIFMWTASSEFGTYRLCEQRRFRRACASAQSRQNLRCSIIQAVSQEEPSDRKPDPWPLWMAGHAQLKFVMTECSKTQIRLARLMLNKLIRMWYTLLHFSHLWPTKFPLKSKGWMCNVWNNFNTTYILRWHYIQ